MPTQKYNAKMRSVVDEPAKNRQVSVLGALMPRFKFRPSPPNLGQKATENTNI
jgi:hypothetical protein